MDATRVPGPLTRLRRRHGLVRSALRRPTDRVEAVATGVLALLAVLVALVAVAVATASYQRGLAEAAAAGAERTRVSAVLLQDPVAQYAPFGDRGVRPPVQAPVRWQSPDGQQGVATLQVARDQRAGDWIAVWVDRWGHLVEPPPSATQALVSAVVTGVDVVVLGWLVLWALLRAACHVLQRINLVRWEAGWARVGPRWSHRTWH